MPEAAFYYFRIDTSPGPTYAAYTVPASAVIIPADAEYGVQVRCAEDFRVHRDQVVPISRDEYEAGAGGGGAPVPRTPVPGDPGGRLVVNANRPQMPNSL